MRTSAKDQSLHFKKVMKFLNRDRKYDKRFCNKTLCSQGESFAIHDGVVASMSDYFNALLGSEMREKYENIINIDKIPPKRLGSVIDYIYTGDIELTEENVLEVLEDADYTQMTDLKSLCGRAILQTISAHNCLKMRAHAGRYNLADVEAKINQTILDNIATIVKQTDFMILDVDEISAILKQATYKNIETLFNGIVSWVNFNLSHREDLFVNLFSQIDLTLLSTHFLARVKNENLVRKNVETCSAVMDAAFNRMAGTSCQSSENHGLSAILIIGGFESPRGCVKYDVTTKQSKMLPKLNLDRTHSTSANVRNKIYVMGGSPATNSCEMMETNNQWKSFANMLQPRQYAASTIVQEQIYVTGGYNGSTVCSSCLCYNVNEDIWRNSFSMLQKRGGHGACSIESTVYCVGGWDGLKNLSNCERHDLRTGTSSKISPLHQTRSFFPCVAMEGLIYAIGGCDFGQTVEVYEPRANKWRNVSPHLKHRSYHSACVVEGRIYVVGGRRNSPASRSVEVYNPISDKWTEAFGLDMESICATVVAV